MPTSSLQFNIKRERRLGFNSDLVSDDRRLSSLTNRRRSVVQRRERHKADEFLQRLTERGVPARFENGKKPMNIVHGLLAEVSQPSKGYLSTFYYLEKEVSGPKVENLMRPESP